MRNAKRWVKQRIAGAREDQGKPMFDPANMRVEMGDTVRAVNLGGIGLVRQLAEQTGLVEAVDRRLSLLKIHRPYHKSDHVLRRAADENLPSGTGRLRRCERYGASRRVRSWPSTRSKPRTGG